MRWELSDNPEDTCPKCGAIEEIRVDYDDDGEEIITGHRCPQGCYYVDTS